MMSGLKVCALISGGKDSCFSMMECVMAGHQIVALANLKPPHQVAELDSHMFQSVGSEAIDLYAGAMDLPLFRSEISGQSVQTSLNYSPKVGENDEVEDLYRLLAKVQSSLHIDAVCSGAILSDYQRIRVENVCSRLNLISLGFLWRRDQSELLREMISFQMNCVVIKVATLGLDQKHLGQSLAQLQDHLMAMETKFGINVCGEGGEYETFTLDCPLFKKSISIDESKVIVHSADAFAPVAFLHLKSLSLKDKIEQANVTSATQMEMLTTNMEIRDYLRHPRDLVSHCHDLRPCFENCENHLSAKLPDDVSSFTLGKSVSYLPSSSCVSFQDGSTGWFAIGNLPIQSRNEGENGAQDDPAEAMEQVFRQLKECLDSHGWSFSDLVSVTLLVSDMAQYAVINQRYVKNFGINPPIRVCVQTHQDSAVILHALGFHLREDKHFALETTRRTMHVQSISHWAPANIGPYSQYVEVDNVIHIAGQIGLIPGCMELIPGGCGPEAKLSFRHVHRILEAHKLGFQAIAQITCYITSRGDFRTVHDIWNQIETESSSGKARLNVIVVPRLPRDASVEWQVLGLRPYRIDTEDLESSKDQVSKSMWNVESGEQLRDDEVVCEEWLSIESQQVDSHVGEIGRRDDDDDDDDQEELEAREKSFVVVLNARLGNKVGPSSVGNVFSCMWKHLSTNSVDFAHFQVFYPPKESTLLLEVLEANLPTRTSISVIPAQSVDESVGLLFNSIIRMSQK